MIAVKTGPRLILEIQGVRFPQMEQNLLQQNTNTELLVNNKKSYKSVGFFLSILSCLFIRHNAFSTELKETLQA